MPTNELQPDVLILGGGAAGLWLLDELHRRGFAVLLVELRALGGGQTIASQGILHGGLKYALSGLRSGSTDSVREMPALWSACLSGDAHPNLRQVRVLSPCCYLWRTESITSRLGMLGARVGLRTPVERVPPADRPPVLHQCPGDVLRVDEPVIDSRSLLQALSDAHRPRIIGVADPCNVAFERRESQQPIRVQLHHPDTDDTLTLAPSATVLTAGEGNEVLRKALGLPPDAMQRRPLHMVMVRGPLPDLFGHCVDGGKTRVTVTSAVDSQSRTVWYLGGELAEQGVQLEPHDLIAHARRELISVLPGIDLSHTQWATYRINRAEGRAPDGRRPQGPFHRREGSVITAWPTKLVLVPRLARDIADQLGQPQRGGEISFPKSWPQPPVATAPWEMTTEWHA